MANQFTDRKLIKATYQVPNSGQPVGTVTLDVQLPVGAIVTNAWYHVVTTFTSASDSATIALTTGQTAGDLVAALAISNASNIWDAGVRGTLAGSPILGTNAANGDTAIEFAAVKAASAIVISSTAKTPALVVAVDTLTAGKLNLFIEYVVST